MNTSAQSVIIPLTTAWRRRNPAKLHAVILLTVLVLAANCFDLIDANAINVAGVFNLDMLWQLLLLAESVVLYMKSRNIRGMGTDRVQGLLFLILMVLCIVAAVRSNMLTGQPLIRGLLPQRGFMMCLIAAMLLRRPFRDGLVDGGTLLRGIVVLGCFSSVLYLLQILMGTSVTFIHAQTGERYGGMRLYLKAALSDVSGFIGLWECMRDDDRRALIPTALSLATIIFVSKGRLELLTYLAVLLFLFLTSKSKATTKTLVVCIVVLAGLVIGTTGGARQIVEGISDGINGTNERNLEVREKGRLYYDRTMEDTGSTFLGCGYPSTLYTPAASLAGFERGYYLVDNGVYGYRYVYGNLGMIVLALCLLSILHTLWLRGKDDWNVLIIAYLLFLIIPCVNLAWWCWNSDWQVMTALFVALTWTPAPGRPRHRAWHVSQRRDIGKISINPNFMEGCG